jgi:hypothetical protein
MPEARKPEQSIELLPRAVLAIGITGHRVLDGANPNTAIMRAGRHHPPGIKTRHHPPERNGHPLHHAHGRQTGKLLNG